jgi:hypothetical protein
MPEARLSAKIRGGSSWSAEMKKFWNVTEIGSVVLRFCSLIKNVSVHRGAFYSILQNAINCRDE